MFVAGAFLLCISLQQYMGTQQQVEGQSVPEYALLYVTSMLLKSLTALAMCRGHP